MRLLYLSMLSFVFIASFALSLSKPKTETIYVTRAQSRDSAALPILIETKEFPILSAQGVIAVDLNSGVTLYKKNPDLPLLPASTTKIMTALVAMEHYSPQDVIKVGRVIIKGQKMGLFLGEEIIVENLLYGLLVFSANDAAEALALNYPGGREGFIRQMNQKAQELGMENTNFVNPSGLENEKHVSTARDMIRLSEMAMRKPYFSEIVRTKEKVVESVNRKSVHYLKNINKLLGKVDGVLGVKTGWTENARENLVTYIERDDKRVLIALLGSQDRFGETEELIGWIFDNHYWEEVDFP